MPATPGVAETALGQSKGSKRNWKVTASGEDWPRELLRPVRVETGFALHAAGSADIRVGNTRVLCTASVEDRQPAFLRNTPSGWITAEYRMLPGSTDSRHGRNLDGRSQEIQRLIGRSLRQAVPDLHQLRGFTITLDCDVVDADGGTRCASITGACIALVQALHSLQLPKLPEHRLVAGVSAGVVDGKVVMDLDQAHDNRAAMDCNLVSVQGQGWVEVQATGEKQPFASEALQQMLELGGQACQHLHGLQEQAIATARG